MATLLEIAREYDEDIRGGIAWIAVWKKGRSWEAQRFYLSDEAEERQINSEDVETINNILNTDSNAIIVNGHYSGHLGSEFTVKEIQNGIRWHYDNGYSQLSDYVSNETAAYTPEEKRAFIDGIEFVLDYGADVGEHNYKLYEKFVNDLADEKITAESEEKQMAEFNNEKNVVEKASIPPLPPTSIYGNYSVIREFAKGVSLILTNASLKIVCVANKIAALFMSKEALQVGDAMSDDYLGFPTEDGRGSVAMFELATKKYIKQNHQQIKQHFNNIVSKFPSYLMARGILSDKLPTLVDKMNDEKENLYDEWMYLSKRDIIDYAEEILARQDIIKYYSDPGLDLPMEGVFLCNPNLVEDTCQFLIENKLTTNDIQKYVDSVVTAHQNENSAGERIESEAIKEQLSKFTAEIETAAPIVAQSVEMQYVCNGTSKDIKLSLTEFLSYIPQEAIDSFAAQKMPDFPCKDYYGAKGTELFNTIAVKRFCEDIINNYNYYAPKTESAHMIINRVSSEPAPDDAMNKLESSTLIYDYVRNCCTNTEKIDTVLKNNLSELSETVAKINNMVMAYQSTAETSGSEFTKDILVNDAPFMDESLLEPPLEI